MRVKLIEYKGDIPQFFLNFDLVIKIWEKFFNILLVGFYSRKYKVMFKIIKILKKKEIPYVNKGKPISILDFLFYLLNKKRFNNYYCAVALLNKDKFEEILEDIKKIKT